MDRLRTHYSHPSWLHWGNWWVVLCLSADFTVSEEPPSVVFGLWCKRPTRGSAAHLPSHTNILQKTHGYTPNWPKFQLIVSRMKSLADTQRNWPSVLHFASHRSTYTRDIGKELNFDNFFGGIIAALMLERMCINYCFWMVIFLCFTEYSDLKIWLTICYFGHFNDGFGPTVCTLLWQYHFRQWQIGILEVHWLPLGI